MKESKKSQHMRGDRARLVGVDVFNDQSLLALDDSLAELMRLADTAGFEVVGRVTQKLDHPHPKTFIGAGKVKEVKTLAEELQADVILFDEAL